nr:IS66 family insertion sequence element accessory protein TnpB [Faecalicatena contorta]
MNNATGFRKIYIAAGYTDLRRGIDGLASIIKFNFQLDPYEKDILFLFCGRRSDRIKGLVWEGDGFLLLSQYLKFVNISPDIFLVFYIIIHKWME